MISTSQQEKALRIIYLSLVLLFLRVNLGAQSTPDSLANELQRTEDPLLRISILSSMVEVYAEKDLDQSMLYAKQGLSLAKETGAKEWIPRFHYHCGLLYQYLSHYDSSLIFQHLASTQFEELGDKARQARALHNIAYSHVSMAQFEKAMEFDFKALRLWEEIGDENGQAEAFVKISDDLYYQERYREGVEYAEKAIGLYNKTGDQEGLSSAYQYAGDNYLILEEYEKALAFMDEALRIKKTLHVNSIKLGSLLNARGNVLKYMERYEEAIANYEESLVISRRLNHMGGISAVLANIGDVYIRMKAYKKALPFKLETIEIQETNGFVAHLPENYMHASMIYEGLGDYKKALGYHKKFKTAQDSVLTLEKDKAMSDLRTRYETEQKENLITAQELELQKQLNRQQLFLGVAFLLVIIIFLLYRGYRIKQKSNALLAVTNQQLEKTNKENELLLREIHHRVKNNLQTVSSLLSLQSDSIEDDHALEVVRDSQNRVGSMALIHQKLYQGKNLATVEMEDYFKSIGETILESYGQKALGITLRTPMNTMELDVDTAIPIGLIVNELVTNSIKHAFPEKRDGIIEVSMQQEQDDQLTLRIADNGVGINGSDYSKAYQESKGFGSRLVQLLTTQLGGKIEQTLQDGVSTVITFKRNQTTPVQYP